MRSAELPPPNRADRKPMAEELKGGLRFVSHGVFLTLTILAACTTALGLPIRAFLPIFAGDPETLSRMMTCLGIGAVFGALVVAWLGKFDRMGATLLWVLALFGATIATFALLPVSLVSYALLVQAGAALLVVFSLTASLVQLTVPDELRGRVMSIYLMAFRGGMPIGSLVSGSLTTVLPTTTVIAMNGGLLVVVAAYFLVRSHGVREL